MDHVAALEQRGRQPLVIDEVPDRLDHLRVLEDLVVLVRAEIVDQAAKAVLYLQPVDGRDRLDVGGRQVADHVHVTLFQQQALGRGFRDVAHEHALHLQVGGAVPVRVRFKDNGFVGRPRAQDIGARAGGVLAQPLVAKILALDVLHDRFHVHDRAGRGGQRVGQEGRRERLVGLDHQRHVVGGADVLFHVLLGQAELRNDERGRQVQLDHALQRPCRILRADRVARRELAAFLHLEGEGLAVLGHRPFRREAGDRLQADRIDVHQRLVHVVDLIAARDFKALRRVHRKHVVDRGGDHQRVGRRFGQGHAAQGGPEQKRAGKDGSAKIEHVRTSCLSAAGDRGWVEFMHARYATSRFRLL